MLANYQRFMSLRHFDYDYLNNDAVFGHLLAFDPHVNPFIIRFYAYEQQCKRTAYLTVADGTVEWYYHPKKDPGHSRCPPLRDKAVLRQLDALFLRYYQNAKLPESLEGLTESLGAWDRVKWMNTYLFTHQPLDKNGILEWDEIAYDLYSWEEIFGFIDWFRYTLYNDYDKLSAREISIGADTHQVTVIEFDGKTRYIDTRMPGNLYLHFLLCLNDVLAPHYELRRYRESEFDYCGILFPMAPEEWQALEAQHGHEAVAAKFERLTPAIRLQIDDDEDF